MFKFYPGFRPLPMWLVKDHNKDNPTILGILEGGDPEKKTLVVVASKKNNHNEVIQCSWDDFFNPSSYTPLNFEVGYWQNYLKEINCFYRPISSSVLEEISGEYQELLKLYTELFSKWQSTKIDRGQVKVDEVFKGPWGRYVVRASYAQSASFLVFSFRKRIYFETTIEDFLLHHYPEIRTKASHAAVEQVQG